jgi:AraC-like DNA-binding protein/quercetin dioxygenase-like cupin family protein
MSPAEKKIMAARQTIRKPKKQLERPSERPPVRQPVVVRTIEPQISGIRQFNSSRYTIGYVLSGTKYIYSGDLREEVRTGDIFFLNRGAHYVEELSASPKHAFEQIMFFYTPEQMGRILASLSVGYGADTGVRHYCPECGGKDYIVAEGGSALKHFFSAVKGELAEGFFAYDPIAELVALTSLVYHIISRPEGCLRTKVLSSTDPEKELMEKLINEYVFSDITLSEFARRNNRSLTSFKKKFKEYFGDSPHRWVTRQRLMHARLQIIQTTQPIVQIGRECRFPNTSHFIKLFREEYGLTPREYRRRYIREEEEQKKRAPQREPA